MNDLLYCESCGAEFELDEDVLLEDEDGNEYIECPECGELYEGFLRRFWKIYGGRRAARSGKTYARRHAQKKEKELEKHPERIPIGMRMKMGFGHVPKGIEAMPPEETKKGVVKQTKERRKHLWKGFVKGKNPDDAAPADEKGLFSAMFRKPSLFPGGKGSKAISKIQKYVKGDRKGVLSAAKFAWKTRKAAGKKPVVKEDYIDEMLEAILEGYHPADVVDELMEASKRKSLQSKYDKSKKGQKLLVSPERFFKDTLRTMDQQEKERDAAYQKLMGR